MTLTAKNILIIDSAIEDRQTLLDGVILGTEIVILDAHLDGIIQITQALKEHTDIDSLHIVSHGSPGCLYLGKTQLNLETLENYSRQLQQWRPSFTETATILLYGCNVAAGDGGEEFIQKLHQITRAEIAASVQPTGNAALGGDWELEVKRGEGKPPLAFDAKARQAYAGVLGIFKVNSTADTNDNNAANGYTLREAIVAANSLPDEDTIEFGDLLGTNTIILTSLLPTLTTDIIFNATLANPLTISGADNYQIFNITNNATVSFKNFTLANGKARGANGDNGNFGGGGGGAAGMGGALFIDSGRVTASGVTFNNNQALGGGGGYGGGFGGDDRSDEVAGKGGGEGGGYPGGYGFGSGGGGEGGGGGFGSGGGGGGYGGGGGGGGFGGGGGGGGLGDAEAYYPGGSGGFGGFGGFGDGGGGGGGGGGAGLGGAVFVKAGTLDLINTTFTKNQATGGSGGLFSESQADNGAGKGGAIFVYTGAKVNFQTLPTFEGNTAANAKTDPTTTDLPADNENVYGTILLTIAEKPNTPPVVANAITAQSATVNT
ncbi:DUF4347 domain-containing protein, partial [Microcoleus sp. T2B6]|uniref:DUF4347 domain-containing protein n=1 Tax=Microcoleus sp. T2B6 TaxID=3055424 RepID=UPI002FD284FD